MDRIADAAICERGNDLIEFLYGEIDERATRDFERHLLNCADCKSELALSNRFDPQSVTGAK